MGKLWIVGMGPGGLETITQETMRVMERASKVILRTEVHPAAVELRAKGMNFDTCDRFYEVGSSFPQIYESIADHVLSEFLDDGEVCYGVPGHPMVAEETVRLLFKKIEDIVETSTREMKEMPFSPDDIRVLPGVSFIDSVFVMLGKDPLEEKVSLYDAAVLWEDSHSNQAYVSPLPDGACLFAQVYNQFIAESLKLALLEEVHPEAEIIILYHAGIKGEEELILCSVAEVDHFKKYDHLTSVYLPLIDSYGHRNRRHDGRSGKSRMSDYPLDQMVEIFRQLLGPDGCPWDLKQTHESLKTYLLEETHEVIEAIDEKDMPHLKEELGDVLMQIVFHSALAEERGDFDINGVIDGITEKLIRRHPHIFGDAKADNPEEVLALWNKIKEEERAGKENV